MRTSLIARRIAGGFIPNDRNTLSVITFIRKKNFAAEANLFHSSGINNAFKIYTRTGDKGKSSLYTGERRVKHDAVFEALGTVDELSSAIGLVREFARDELHMTENDEFDVQLHTMQCVLQDIGSFIATPRADVTDEKKLKRTEIDSSVIETLETWIDSYTAELPPLKNFILPGGGKTSAAAHVARTICRRAERRVCELYHSAQTEQLPVQILNRFSDYLFTLARYASKRADRSDEIYRKSSGQGKAAVPPELEQKTKNNAKL